MKNRHQETSERKKDHIDLAFASQINGNEIDSRFYYEPLLCGHPDEKELVIPFAGHKLTSPIWVSSMTGGTKHAGHINRNLARACKEFGMGMGLGSCRIILDDNEHFEDFNLRPLIGDNLPFYANLGIAQVENLLKENKLHLMQDLVSRLQADGLIIHINPLQEWLQPEGDRIENPPLDTIKRMMDSFKGKLIVKEVGQGMGPKSIRALMELPLEAIEFAAAGGTNFAKLELSRAETSVRDSHQYIANCGHTAAEMVDFVNSVICNPNIKCSRFIISGGVKNYLDGYYLTNKCRGISIYGQASELLKRAKDDYEGLAEFLHMQVQGYKLAKAFLRIKE